MTEITHDKTKQLGFIPSKESSLCHREESRDFRGLKNGGFLSTPLPHSGKTFFDISVNTDQIGMGFEADTPGERKQHVHL